MTSKNMYQIRKVHLKCGKRVYATNLQNRAFCRHCWEYLNEEDMVDDENNIGHFVGATHYVTRG